MHQPCHPHPRVIPPSNDGGNDVIIEGSAVIIESSDGILEGGDGIIEGSDVIVGEAMTSL